MLHIFSKILSGDATVCASRSIKIGAPSLFLLIILGAMALFGSDGFIAKLIFLLLVAILIVSSTIALLNSAKALLTSRELPQEIKSYTYYRSLIGVAISCFELLFGLILLL